MNRHRNGEDSGGWQIAKNRRQKKKDKLMDGMTTFFIANLPTGCSSELLWKIFRSFGTMVDSYIPARKDRGGNTYGFIRFIKVADVRLMEEQLNTVKIDGAKIAVNQAKYGKDQRRSNNMSAKGTAHVSRPPHIVSGAPTRNIGLSYRDVLHGVQHNQPPRGVKKSITLSGEEPKHFVEWQNRALLGETSSMKKLENVAVGLKAEGVKEITIKYIGGLHVLVIFESEVAAKGFLVAGKPTWSNWFASLELWSDQKITYQRVAWVKIEGIPFHVWESSCFDSIDGLFGIVISPAHSPIKSMDMSTSCIGILVDSVSRIEEFVEVLWREEKYMVLVSEDVWPWIPNFVDEGCDSKLEEVANVNPLMHVDEDENQLGVKNLEEGEFCPEDADFDEDEDLIYIDPVPVKPPCGTNRPACRGEADADQSPDTPSRVVSSPPTRINDAVPKVALIPNEDTHAPSTTTYTAVNSSCPMDHSNVDQLPLGPISPVNGIGSLNVNSARFVSPTPEIIYMVQSSAPDPPHHSDTSAPAFSSDPIHQRRRPPQKTPHKRPPHSLKLKDSLWGHRAPLPSSSRPTSSSQPPSTSTPQVCRDPTLLEPHVVDSIQTEIESEVSKTIEVGKCLGFQLEGFEEQVKILVGESAVGNVIQ